MCFFVKDAATSDIYPYCHTLSLHDALPIWDNGRSAETDLRCSPPAGTGRRGRPLQPCRTSARHPRGRTQPGGSNGSDRCCGGCTIRSEEHTSELQSLMRISYAVFCLKKKKTNI